MTNIADTLSQLHNQVSLIESKITQQTIINESYIKFQYELKGYIDSEIRKKTDPTVILNAVVSKLKLVTPHGAANTVDA
jgi:hypothetical protein